ncbi:MAG: hypothetical protein RBU30_06130, partial [Polyangia bacterium]|nr:hypothetical protein [Polyangia bacterium]
MGLILPMAGVLGGPKHPMLYIAHERKTIVRGSSAYRLEEPRGASRSLEDLEDEITLLSATIQAATYRLLLLVGEVDSRGLWADPL